MIPNPRKVCTCAPALSHISIAINKFTEIIIAIQKMHIYITTIVQES